MTSIPAAPPLSPTQLRSVLVGLMLGLFLAALDQTIVAVTLPDIAQHLPGSELLAWVVSGYLLAMTVTTPIFGKLGDLLGRRRLLALAIGLFVLASLLCGLAQDMAQLVAGRVLQGIGAGGLLATIQALIGDLIAPAERGRYQAWFSGMFALASLIGPSLGGLLSSQWSWRWVFWINLPLGALAWFLCQRRLAGLVEKRRDARIDYLGSALLILGLGSLLVLVTRLGQQPQWLLAPNGLSLLLGVTGLALFAWQQSRSAEPLIPPGLLRLAPVRSGWLLLFFANFQGVGLAVLIPLQAHSAGGAGTSASQLMAVAFGAPLGAYIAGSLSARLQRYKPMILCGTLLMPLSLVLLALLPNLAGPVALLILLMCGAALGLQFPTALVAVQSAAPSSHLGVATGVCGLFRGLGGALGAALLSSLLWRLLPDCPSCALSEAGVALPTLDREALHNAFRHLLLIDAGLALLPLLIALRLEDRTLSRQLNPPA
ncbi:MFS transporter [Pseudomonas cavernae]|uniref:MFS transporter n=1 Tax=Pseudomonas cavernae TaxID=2320867 RepID=A0A385Z0Y0_9PSED|nr:MFS transporter [Pseudomonas cavernae]AYC32344.1 MFS transporter [Pseudomonas cavernae]